MPSLCTSFRYALAANSTSTGFTAQPFALGRAGDRCDRNAVVYGDILMTQALIAINLVSMTDNTPHDAVRAVAIVLEDVRRHALTIELLEHEAEVVRRAGRGDHPGAEPARGHGLAREVERIPVGADHYLNTVAVVELGLALDADARQLPAGEEGRDGAALADHVTVPA